MSQLGELYVHGPTTADDEPMVKLLRDDIYRRNRRRRVPEPQAEGRELYLFDLQIDEQEIGLGPSGGILVACLATRGDDGVIKQIPWAAVDGTVTA
ncbi:MAG: hypothetical protein IRY99_24595 [Isosphaeraceae bacterium]|nr:hypothetical protein [Isosphaeraceae bacterium]